MQPPPSATCYPLVPVATTTTTISAPQRSPHRASWGGPDSDGGLLRRVISDGDEDDGLQVRICDECLGRRGSEGGSSIYAGVGHPVHPPPSPTTLTSKSPKAGARAHTPASTTVLHPPIHPTTPRPRSLPAGRRSRLTTTRSPAPRGVPNSRLRSVRLHAFAKQITAQSALSHSRQSTLSAAAKSCASATWRYASAACPVAAMSQPVASADAAIPVARGWWCGGRRRRIAG